MYTFPIRFIYLYLFLFLKVYGPVSAQGIFVPEAHPKILTAKFTWERIQLDGQLTEASWSMATTAQNFFQLFPNQGDTVGADTRVSILYDAEFLYVGAICVNPDGRKNLRAPFFKRDHEEGSHDVFGVAIDAFQDRRNAVYFATDPWGTQRDLLSFDDQQYDIEWSGLWKVRTSRLDSAWIVEMAIPWKSLRYPTGSGGEQIWNIQFYRLKRSTNESSTWNPVPRSYGPLRIAYAGELHGLIPPQKQSNIQVQPYLLATHKNYRDTINHILSNALKVGGDIKWAIDSRNLLDITINTDFAQADVDFQVNNLNRSSIFLPERRPFFLENASLFGVGLSPIGAYSGGPMRIQPFFSRRIGLSSAGEITPIQAGLRFVHRSPRDNYSLMILHQEHGNSSADFFVGRISKNIGKQNRIGALFTDKKDADAHHVNGSVDGFFRFGQNLSLSYLGNVNWIKDTISYAGYYRLYHLSNRLSANWTQSIVTENYSNELGFVSRTNVIATTPGFFIIEQIPWLPSFIRFFEPGVFLETYHNYKKRYLQEFALNVNPIWFVFQNGSETGYLVKKIYQRLDELFQPLGIDIEPGDYSYYRHQFYFSTDQSRKFSITINYESGRYYNWKLATQEFSFRIAPIPHISINAKYTHNLLHQLGDEVHPKEVDLLRVESRVAVNPRIQLISLFQYNTTGNIHSLNTKLTWEYKPLSFIHLIYNSYHDSFYYDSSENLILKLSLIKQI